MNFRVVLRNAHPSTDTDEIAEELYHWDLKVVRIKCMRQANTKNLLHYLLLNSNSEKRINYNVIKFGGKIRITGLKTLHPPVHDGHLRPQ